MIEPKVGDKVYFLSEYNWEAATCVAVNRKTYTLQFPAYMNSLVRRIPKEKCATEHESVCVVWETWKGVNGRGGYRVERTLYPQHRLPANQVARQHRQGQGRVEEP